MTERLPDQVAVEVMAFNFPTFGAPVPNASIRALGSPQVLAVTDRRGRAILHRPVGEALTLVLEKPGFQSTQTATVTVPPEGLLGRQRELTAQTLWAWFFKACKWWFHVPLLKARRHHLATTVTAAGKTLYDAIQGEPGATVRLMRDGQEVDVEPIYLGVLPRVHKTDLFSVRFRRLANTSMDGGVLFPNVPPGTYTIETEKPGAVFSSSTVVIGHDSPEYVNVSPPWGPRVIAPGC